MKVSIIQSQIEEIEALSDHVDTGEDPFLTMLSDSNELEEEKQDLSSTNLNEIKSVKLEDLSDHEKSHSTLDNDDHLLEKEEKDSSNAESSLSQGINLPYKRNFIRNSRKIHLLKRICFDAQSRSTQKRRKA